MLAPDQLRHALNLDIDVAMKSKENSHRDSEQGALTSLCLKSVLSASLPVTSNHHAVVCLARRTAAVESAEGISKF